MKYPRPTSIALLLSGLALSSSADTFNLKDGSTIEGDIALKSADSYTLLVEVQKGVRDEVVIKKTDILSISKEDLSLEAFKALPKLIPTADLLTADDYQSIIDKKISPFLKKYPESGKLDEAKKIKAVLLSEMAQAKSGSIKVDGKWLTAEDLAHNKYEFEALTEANKVKKYARKGDFGMALTTLSKMEKEYKNTKPYHDALDMSLRFLPIYKAKAQKVADNADKAVKKREQSLERLASSDKGRVKRILAAEEAAYQSQVSATKQAGSKWLPLNRFHEDSANSVLQLIDRETSRLQKIADTEYVDGGALYRTILEAIDKNELDTAKDELRNFSRVRPPKEHATYLKEQYTEAVTQMRLVEKQKRAEAAEERLRAREEAKNAAKKAKEEAQTKETPEAPAKDQAEK